MTESQTTRSTSSWASADARPLAAMLGTGLFSLISNVLTGLAVPWFVLELTGSAAKMGLTAAVTMLPAVVMMFLGGAIADRMNPKWLSVLSDVISGVTVALVPLLFLLDVLTFPLLLALMVAGALFDSPGYAARSKLLPQLAQRAGIEIERVASLQGVFQAVSTLFGAVLAGILISALGATSVLWINAGSFAISALVMWLLVPDLHVAREEMPSVVEDIKHGLRYVWQHPVLRPLTGAALVINAVFAPITAVMLPFLAKSEWDSATSFGLLISGFGAGNLLGSLTMGKLSGSISRSLVLRLSLVCMTLPVFALATVPSLPLAWLAVLMVGIGTGLVNPMIMALFFRTTEPGLLGRVNGVISSAAMLASPLGILVATAVLESWGLPITFVAIGLILALTTVLLFRSPLMRLIDDAPEHEENRIGALQSEVDLANADQIAD